MSIKEVTKSMILDRIEWRGKEYVWPTLTNIEDPQTTQKFITKVWLLLLFCCMEEFFR